MSVKAEEGSFSEVVSTKQRGTLLVRAEGAIGSVCVAGDESCSCHPTETSVRRIRHWYGRFRLAGALVLLPLFVLISAGGGWIWRHGASQITPASVKVSGYVRADGTRVSGYSRRPAGSVDHDRPYEAEAFFGFVVMIAGALASGRIIYRALLTPDIELLPRITRAPVQRHPLRLPSPSTIGTRSRAPWNCTGCRASFAAGSNYFYHVERGERWRFCAACAETQRIIAAAAAAERAVLIASQEAESTLAWQVQYRNAFGHDPPPDIREPRAHAPGRGGARVGS